MTIHNFQETLTDDNNTELNLFMDICYLLESNINLEDTLNPIFMIVADYFEIEDGAITIYDQQKEEIYIDSSYGLSAEEKMKGQYKTGEGIIGQVVQSKQVMIIPDISQEKRFLEKTKQRGNRLSQLAFICIPILYQQKILGTISITPPKQSMTKLLGIANKLKVLSFLIAPAVVRRLTKLQSIDETPFLTHENSQLRIENLLGNSGIIKDFKMEIYKISKLDTHILIYGEEGSGKTFFAHAIHYASNRKTLAPISYYCYKSDNKPPKELEKEFNTALHQAQNSTLIIEEFTLLPLVLQKHIIQILFNKEYAIHNSIEPLKTRCVFTSSDTISVLKDNALIDEQLYALLIQNKVTVPPLRKRKNDIVIFMNHFLNNENKRFKKNIKRISTPAINLLTSYHWPGNVSELQQVINYAYRSCESGVIHAHLLPPSLQSAESSNTNTTESFHIKISQVETDLIIDALKSSRGNIKQAALLLQLTERQLGLRINKYAINPRNYK